MPPKVISFDGDNTLWDFDAALRSALSSVLEHLNRMGAPPAGLDVDRLIQIRSEVGVEWDEETASLRGMRKESLRRSAVESGLTPNGNMVEKLFKTFIDARDSAITPYQDVVGTLSALRADGWTIALLTNGNARLESTGLAQYLDVSLYAEEIGVRKPHRGAFEEVCGATGCELVDLVHVGDSLENDVGGAVAVGATAVWINRTGLSRTDGIQPHCEISSLSQLPAVLTSLNTK